MKKNEIKVGGVYVAKVSDKLTTVRVDAIRESFATSGNGRDVYDVTNLKTGRKTTFRSAMKFRREVPARGTVVVLDVIERQLGEEYGPALQPGETQELLGSLIAAAKSIQEERGSDPTSNIADGECKTDSPSSPLASLPLPVNPSGFHFPSAPTGVAAASSLSALLQRSIDKVNADKALADKALADKALADKALADKGDTAPHLIIEARAGTGKCLGRGTLVLLYDGTIVPVEDVEEGDVLMGPDSRPRNVLSIAEGGFGPLYRIVPTKGESWVCNDAHVLTLAGTNHVMGKIRDVSVTDYLAELYDRVPNCESWKLLRTGVFFPTTEAPRVPAYLVGIWMGDGSRSGAEITNNRKEIQDFCQIAAAGFGIMCKISPDSREHKNTSRIRFTSRNRTDKGSKTVAGENELYTFFKTRCVVGELKTIPREYLTASEEVRLDLLAGIVDTDGESTGNSNTFVGVTGEPYRNDLLFLARSLGFAAYQVSSDTHTCNNGKVSTYYSISIAGDLNRLPTLVRKFPPRKQIKRVLVTGFDVEDAGNGEYFGFTLDSDGRFLLGDFTVTHNTTTLIEGLKRIKGIPSDLVPSPQQAAVWEAMELSKGHANSICFVAFNKSIATELQARVPKGCDAMTMHSMGFKAVTKALGRQEPNSYVVQDTIAELVGQDIRWLRSNKPTLLKATEELVSLCKMNLVDHDAGNEWFDSLRELASHYDVDLNHSRAEVFALVPRVLEACKSPNKGKISFDDMIWLPIVLNLPIYRYDVLLVDEAQDLNRCQQDLAKRAGKRLILCGDPKQAIYGFAGADSESMSRMGRELGDDEYAQHMDGERAGRVGRGCITLPLTVTRRCGKAIVREAQKIVPDFEAFETNPEGQINYASFKDESSNIIGGMPGSVAYHSLVQAGDFILCRVNAPLVSQCFRFLKQGRKANIQGRDIGAGLISTIKKMKASGVSDLVGKIDDWLSKESAKEQAKRNPNEAKLIALQDRADCITCFTEGADTVDDVIRKVESIFTDDKTCTGIRLSSVHKAKGLEARRVFILQPKGAECPHPMAKTAWQREQEYNLLYVAITRAIEEIVWVS